MSLLLSRKNFFLLGPRLTSISRPSIQISEREPFIGWYKDWNLLLTLYLDSSPVIYAPILTYNSANNEFSGPEPMLHRMTYGNVPVEAHRRYYKSRDDSPHAPKDMMQL